MKERVLICGDRSWTNQQIIIDTLRNIQVSPGVEVVIEGEATGADTMGRLAAERLGILVEKYPAYWRINGLAAGPIRNYQMLKEGKPTLVLAFHEYIEKSRGTRHMVGLARQAGIPVKQITGRLPKGE